MGDNEDMVDICLRVGDAFVPKRVSKDRQLLCWCGGWCYWRRKVLVSKLDVQEIRSAAIHGFVNGDMEVPVYFNCWYRKKGKTFNTGRREPVNSDEVRGLLETRNVEGYVEVFVTAQPNLKPTTKAQPNPQPKDKVTKKRKKGQSTSIVSIRRSPRFKKTETEREESPPREKLKGKVAEAGVSGSSKQKSKLKGKASAKAKALVFEEDDDGDNKSDYSSSDLSDEDLDWEPGEEEFDEGDEEWFIEGSKDILEKVNKNLRKLQGSGIDEGVVKDKRSDLKDDLDIRTVRVNPEGDEGDSESSRSLCGSDSEEDTAPWFNEDVDFQKPIQLQVRQKFKNAAILRRVLRLHAIQERYEFYFLHNDSKRITMQCRYRCDCEFNSYTCRMPACTCVGGGGKVSF
ncbi:uncharacterized protein LOC110722964 [Chenopodium quinoa]|uniref:uncharacterized protein LOC110722964 n=1 Tax=Chenopodium quinoa TaxID=63459 RepID=UPI000B78C279|nr:uncharacterized protein LOC110722964 [Chenopodium quinoa]XP_021757934.1 uncharacterized protein LOC110722964 [Chenopodium quinoa]